MQIKQDPRSGLFQGNRSEVNKSLDKQLEMGWDTFSCHRIFLLTFQPAEKTKAKSNLGDTSYNLYVCKQHDHGFAWLTPQPTASYVEVVPFLKIVLARNRPQRPGPPPKAKWRIRGQIVNVVHLGKILIRFFSGRHRVFRGYLC